MVLKIITKLLIVMLALLLSAHIIPGIAISGLYAVFISAIFLGFVNLFIRPVLVLLMLPITVLTLGTFIFVVNAFLFWFVSSFISGFTVDGFIPAFLGTLMVSVVSWIGNRFLVE